MIGFIRAFHAASVFSMPQGEWRFLVRNSDTDGAWSVVLLELAPGGVGAEPHWHAEGSEAIFVLEGALQVVLEGENRRLGPGEILVVPPGYLHSFRNTGDEPARALMLLFGLDMESYHANSALILDETVLPEDRLEYARRHDVHMPPSAMARAAGSI